MAQRAVEQGFLPPSENFNRGRFNFVVISEIGIGTLATIGLQYLWYKKFREVIFIFLMIMMNGLIWIKLGMQLQPIIFLRFNIT